MNSVMKSCHVTIEKVVNFEPTTNLSRSSAALSLDKKTKKKEIFHYLRIWSHLLFNAFGLVAPSSSC